MSNDKINRALAEAMGFRVFRPSEVKWRSDSQQGELYESDTNYYILPKKKRPQTHMLDARPLPNFDKSIDYAFQLVEWMRRERGLNFEFITMPIGWSVYVFTNHTDISASVRHESLPTAISLAAARALGITEEV